MEIDKINLEHFEEKELSEQEKEYKRILEERGMIYQGIQEFENGKKFVCFKTGEGYNWSNGMAIFVEDFNDESLKEKIEENIKKFNKDK